MRRRDRRVAALLAVVVGAASCSSANLGSFVWVEDYQPAAVPARPGVIRPGDAVDVRVLGQDQLSARARVLSDGRVALPFVGEVEAAGLTAPELASLVEKRLRDYVITPVVTVTVEQATPAPVSVLGEVAHPGKYDFAPRLSVLDALALAGGLTEYARKDRVFVLRGSASPTRIRFAVRRLMRGEGRGLSFTLEPADVVVVE